MLRRVTVAAIVVLTLGVMLMTFPAVRALGASVLASAGVISVVAALAAQSTLGNLFAGLQLAFSDAVRIDDVVVVEGEWGRIEELTLTYVAVQIWDDRRLILPDLVLHHQAVPELDPDRVGGARHRGDRRRLVGAGRATARRAAARSARAPSCGTAGSACCR